MPRFTEQVEAAVEALSSDPAQPMDENEFIDASRLVYDGIRDIRKAVLMIRVSTACLSTSLSFPSGFFFLHSLSPTSAK